MTDRTSRTLLKVIQELYGEQAQPIAPLIQWWAQRRGVELQLAEIQNLLAPLSSVRICSHASKRLHFWVELTEPPLNFAGFVDAMNNEELRTHLRRKDAEDFEYWVACTAFLCKQGGWRLPTCAFHDKYEIVVWLRTTSGLLGSLNFGEVLGLVGIMMGQRVIAKREGRLVPFTQSDDFIKLENARCWRPTGVLEGEAYVASWRCFRRFLHKLLKLPEAQCQDGIRPSCLKPLFRQHFHLEVSETALGHISVTSMLADPELAKDFVMTVAGPRQEQVLTARKRCLIPVELGLLPPKSPGPNLRNRPELLSNEPVIYKAEQVPQGRSASSGPWNFAPRVPEGISRGAASTAPGSDESGESGSETLGIEFQQQLSGFD